MEKKILLTAFRNTSAELLVQEAGEYQILLLPNDKVKDSERLIDALYKEEFAYIISFGQRTNIKNKVHIETTARDGEVQIATNFDCEWLKQIFENQGVVAKISHNAGSSFCNRLYWNGLRYISEKKLNTQMVFVHIPFEKNIDDFTGFRQQIFQVIDVLGECKFCKDV